MAKDVAKARSIKITDAMWSRWQASAKAAGVSVTAVIIRKMEAKAVKAVAALDLPVLTEMPKRETYLRGQAPEKEKGKR